MSNYKTYTEFLQELIEALDALPRHELIAGCLLSEDPVAEAQCCALGAVGLKRGLRHMMLEYGSSGNYSTLFDVAIATAQKVWQQNDRKGPPFESPAHRWQRMRDWALAELRKCGKEPLAQTPACGHGHACHAEHQPPALNDLL